MNYKTEQENFWAGEFGTKYISRNYSEKLIYSKVAMWTKMLKATNNIKSATELGCNIGLNLLALNRLNPNIVLSGYEINETAAKQASQLNIAQIHQGSILEPIDVSPVDLIFTVGVLIHINPDYLPNVYQNLLSCTVRYVLLAEYYNPVPTIVNYRGHKKKLFKRDFAGELIDNYGLKLIDYGFVYKKDNWAPQDDITWFLLEK